MYIYVYIIIGIHIYIVIVNEYNSRGKKKSFLMTSDPTPPLASGLPSDGTVVEMSNFDILISAVISNIDTNIGHSGGGWALWLPLR